MAAVAILARNEIRRRWRYIVVLTLLVGVVGALVLASAAGARRSGSALRRFNAASRTSNLEIDVQNPTAAQMAALYRTPDVVAVAALHAYALTTTTQTNLAVAAAVDPSLGTVVDRARLIAGRLVNPDAVDEITISESLAAELHLGVGGHLDAVSLTPDQLGKSTTGKDPGAPRGPRLRWQIVGIVRRPLDLGDRSAAGGVVVLTPAFDRAYAHRIGLFSTVLRVRLRHGEADVPQASVAARQIFGRSSFFQLVDLGLEGSGAQDAVNVLTQALWIFGGVLALAGIVALGIVIAREISQSDADQDTLRSLGLTHRQRILSSGARAVPIAVGGAVLAVIGALAASPLLPTGIARRADPDPGAHFDALVLGIGFLVVVVFVLVVAGVTAMRATRPLTIDDAAAGARSSATIAEAAAGAGLPPTLTNGLRMALQRGRGKTAVPVRSAFLGAAFGVLGIAAVLVFAASLTHLADTPKLYGWTFDFKAPDDTFANVCNRNDFGLHDQTGIADLTSVCFQPVEVDNRSVTGWGFAPIRGSIGPEILAGHAPVAPNEVALGSQTLHALKLKIGDTVTARGAGKPVRYRIVGRAVFPRLMLSNIQPLNEGAAFANAGILRILDTSNSTRYLLGRFAPGADRAVVEQRISVMPAFQPTAAGQGFANDRGIGLATPPPEITRLQHIGWFAPTLAALLGALALVALGHALITSARRRRRELALLKTLGFDRRQVRATIAWQATALMTVGLGVGIPIGMIVGNQVWHVVARGLGVSTTATMPRLAFAAIAVGALALVNLIAAVPARAAARTRPAVALRD